MEAELVCVDSYGKKAGLGVLTDGGFMFTVPLHTVRKLLNPECALLSSLGNNQTCNAIIHQFCTVRLRVY